MKRSAPLPKKRKTKRRTTSPRCDRQRCTRPQAGITEQLVGLCKTHLVREADRLMSLHVRSEVGQCQACGSTQTLQWAHVHSRRYLAIRWDRENSTCLCARCHAFFTHKPLEWEEWCHDQGIPWVTLRMRALNGAPMDPLRIIAELAGDDA